jgi:hypothetical protein
MAAASSSGTAISHANASMKGSGRTKPEPPPASSAQVDGQQRHLQQAPPQNLLDEGRLHVSFSDHPFRPG